ncbi:arp2/3 complex subunit, partial [Spiromyces aspiralis]
MSYREIDIDRFYQDELAGNLEALSTQTEQEAEALLQQKTTKVRGALSHRNPAEALAAALDSPPYGSNLKHAQAANARLVMDVLAAVRTSEIAQILAALTDDQEDVLMKYIYHGLARPGEYNSNTCRPRRISFQIIYNEGGVSPLLGDCADTGMIRVVEQFYAVMSLKGALVGAASHLYLHFHHLFLFHIRLVYLVVVDVFLITVRKVRWQHI